MEGAIETLAFPGLAMRTQTPIRFSVKLIPSIWSSTPVGEATERRTGIGSGRAGREISESSSIGPSSIVGELVEGSAFDEPSPELRISVTADGSDRIPKRNAMA